uniref:Dual oxidase maturation factor 1-like n=1 Tax=Hirondellea gigas TaxID=1518452 RepID=A0A2P2I2M9_9CRUS
MSSPGFFSSFRDLPFPTLYPENKTAVTVDVLETGWIVAFCILAIGLYVFVPCHPKKGLVFARITIALFLGFVIMYCNFGHQWEVGEVRSLTPYKAGSATEINATIAVKFGLRAVNITLKATPPPGDLEGEKINYNERFSWTWSQGRAGFGPMAGRIQREYREHQIRGTPLPILWVAEYFTFDGEGIRFGRHYRLAGYYAHICMWAALPAWLLTVILSNMVVKYGAYMLTLTGACLTSAALIWSSIRNPGLELKVPFDPPEGILTTRFGANWYLALIVGLICMLFGILVVCLEEFTDYHDELCEILGINPNAYVDQEYGIDDEGEDNIAAEVQAETIENIEMAAVTTRNTPDLPPPLPPYLSVRVRGRGTSKRQWKTHKIPENPIYENQQGGPPVPQFHRLRTQQTGSPTGNTDAAGVVPDNASRRQAPAPPQHGAARHHHPIHQNPDIQVAQHLGPDTQVSMPQATYENMEHQDEPLYEDHDQINQENQTLYENQNVAPLYQEL